MNQARQMLARRLTRRGLSLPAALTAPLLLDGAAQAALSPLLTASTIRAGLTVATGNAVKGIVSLQVVALAESGTASLMSKKASLTLILMASLTLGVGGLLAHRAVGNHTSAETPAAPPAPSAQRARSLSKDRSIEINGRVFDPDGKPLAGTKMYVSPPRYRYKDRSDLNARATQSSMAKDTEPRPLGGAVCVVHRSLTVAALIRSDILCTGLSKSDADGRFRFMASRTEVDREQLLAAIAPGYGLDWVSLKEVRNGKELTLRLVKDDVPLNVSPAVVPINPSAGDPKSLICDIVLDPGRDVSGVAVGADDRPQMGVKAEGLVSVLPLESKPELPDNHFTDRALEVGKPRTVVFWHESKGLARAVAVRAEDKAPLTVRLEQRGEAVGRLVGAKGQPLRGIAVIPRLSDKQTAPLAYFKSASNFGQSSLPKAVLPAPVSTNAEGRFRIKGLVSGLNYSLLFRDKEKVKGIAEKEIAIKSGATVDVGEIKMKAAADAPQRWVGRSAWERKKVEQRVRRQGTI